MQAQQSGNPAFRNGLIFGLIIAALGIVDDIIQWVTGAYTASVNQANNPGTGTLNVGTTLLGCAVFLISLALCFVAGMNTARATGKVGSGAIAGLVAGLVGAIVGGIIGIVVILVLIAPNIHVDTSATGVSVTAILIGAAVIGLIVGLLIDGGLGAGLGALGGLVGRGNYQGAAPTGYQEALYQGMGGQPGYPAQPQPGYPPQPQPGYPPQQYPTQPGSYPPPPPQYPGQ